MNDEPFRLQAREKQTSKQHNLETIKASKLPFREANKGEALLFRTPGKPTVDFYPSTGRWRDLGLNQTFEGGAEAFLSYYRNAPQPFSQHKEPTMPKLNEMFPSNYLKAADIDDEADLVLTISRLAQTTLGQGAQAQEKWVVHFKETDKGLVLNKTNTSTIAKLYGDDTDDWEGRKIALFATEVDFQGSQMLAIRVRARAPKSGKNKGTGNGSGAAPAPAGPAGMPARDVNLGDKPGFDETAGEASEAPKPPAEIAKLLKKYELAYPFDADALDAIKEDVTDKDFMVLMQHAIPFTV